MKTILFTFILFKKHFILQSFKMHKIYWALISLRDGQWIDSINKRNLPAV